MLWVPCVLVTAAAFALVDLYGKRGLEDVDGLTLAWSTRLSGPLVLVGAVAVLGWPALDGRLWLYALASGGLNALAIALYMRALDASPVSRVAPLKTFQPAFLLVFGPLIVGESPPAFGILGVVVLVVGAYLLHVDQADEGGETDAGAAAHRWAPLRALVTDPGAQLMMLVVAAWSAAMAADAVGARALGSIRWAGLTQVLTLGALSPLVVRRHGWRMASVDRGQWRALLPVALLSGVAAIALLTAFRFTFAAYAVALLQVSSLISVGLGVWLLGEGGLKERMAGSAVMALGAAVILLA